MAKTDKFQKKGASTVTTLSSPGKAIGASSITVGSTANYPTDTGLTIAIRVVDTNGKLVAGTYTEWQATVSSGTTFSIDTTPSYGSDQVYAAGSTTQVLIPLSSYSHNKMIDGLLVSLDQDGTLKAGAVDVAAVLADSVVTTAKIADSNVTEAKLTHRPSEYVFDHIASGCVWSGDAYGSTRNASCTSGVVYLSGKRLTVAAVTARSFTASKDVYCDLHDNGDGTAVWVYTDNTTNAASPALTAGNLRGAIIVVGASNIAAATSVNQGQETMLVPIASSVPYAVTDSLGNLICPRDPNRKILGYKQITTTFTTSSSSYVQVTGLSSSVIVPASSRRAKITLWAYTFSAVAGGNPKASIWDGTVGSGTQIAETIYTGTNSGAVSAMAIVTPSTTSKTYNIGMLNTGSASSTLFASSVSPAFIQVELI